MLLFFCGGTPVLHFPFLLSATFLLLSSFLLLQFCIPPHTIYFCWSQWLRGLRRRSTTVRLLGSWVQIPPGAWMFVCCECCVLSGRGLCDKLAPRPGKSYQLWCVVVCKFETSWMRSQNKAGWTIGQHLQQIDNVAI